MNRITKLTFSVVLVMISHAILAQSNTVAETVTWIEGKNVIRLTVVPDEVAEILTGEEGASSSGLPVPGSSTILATKNRVRIWKIAGDAERARLFAGPAGRSYSQVFLDSSGRKKALPGNIVVFMKKGMGEEEVIAWASRKNLKLIRLISRYSNSYLIGTGPGMEALILSNSLNGDESVVVSTPNWWTDVSTR